MNLDHRGETMNEEERDQLYLTAITGLGIAAVAGVWYGLVRRKERMKRKKIQAWYDLNYSAVVAFQRRMMDILNDPNATEADFWEAWKEEQAFMNLIHDQPMY
jgi:hypothetical protein